MDRGAGLLAGVLAAPDDDAARLVYADWLMEQRDPRGELISLQCALARRSLDPQRREEYRARVEQLLGEHEGAWAAGAAKAEARFFRRGFLDEVRGKAKAILPTAEELFQAEPIRRLALTDVTKEAARTLAASSFLGRITHLTLQGSFGDDGLGALARSPHLTSVVSLNLGPKIGPRGAAALAASPHIERVVILSLTSNALGDAGATALSRAPLSACTALHLSRNEIGDEGVTALAGSRHLGNLGRLSLNFNEEISNEGAQALAKSPHLTSLRCLEIEGTEIEKAGVKALRKRFAQVLD
jgi:uncharacterized protein (TIGR02996 family)